MPTANCRRFHELRESWEKAEQRLQEPDAGAAEMMERDLALGRLRAHGVVCEECIDALFAGFPETKGKTRIMERLP